MALLKDITQYTNEFLNIAQFKDYAPNGLQVEGRADVECIVSGVSATRDLIDAAIEKKADLLLVHHGFFWKNESPVITGMKKKRIQALLENNISLLGYHLPLDAHPELGNNAELGKLLGLNTVDVMNREGVGNVGFIDQQLSLDDFSVRIEKALDRTPLVISGGDHPVNRVAWCTGGAQGYIHDALALNADTYITGEVSENTVHVAKESGIHFISAGHHATERYGVKALGEHLSERFNTKHYFIDIDNPV